MQKINEALCRLWEKHEHELNDAPYAPMQYPQLNKNALLFVGLNPSFSDKGWTSLMPYAGEPGLNPHEFFRWPRPDNFDIQTAHKLEQVARDRYAFFAPHRALARALEMPWDHVDLFAYRMTDQKDAKAVLFKRGNKVVLKDFGKSQFALFEEMLAFASPRAVIVVNALASTIYRDLRQPQFDSATGYYRDQIGEHAFPLFFSGMITGGRALDMSSRQRLFWQIVTTLGKQWKPGMESISEGL